MKYYKATRILGINFFKGNVREVVDLLKTGGLLVVPAAPALITITYDSEYYQSLQDADIIIPDSGYMTLIWNLMWKEKITRISGLEFLVSFLDDKEIKKEHDFLMVDPQLLEATMNANYLRDHDFDLPKDVSYVAPFYKKDDVTDTVLLSLIEAKKPKYIIINLGGGVQEKLGAYLKRKLSYSPAIICTGAAIAFLTGTQAKIPSWADKFYMGWLMRCIHKPSVYIPRYLKAFKLVALMLRYGKNTPTRTEPATLFLK